MFDLKCLFPNGGHDLLATFNDGICSKVQSDSKKSQSQDDGKSNEESRNVLCAIVGGFSAWEFAFVCCVVTQDGFVLWQLGVCFD